MPGSQWIQGLGKTLSPETAAMLKARRIELGLSLRQAGKSCGISYEYVRRLESGIVAPKVYTAEYIAKGLGLNPEQTKQLLGESSPRGWIADRLTAEELAEKGLVRDTDGYLHHANTEHR
jgi:transcriptional regulator with XRE-family HTH domain